MNKSIVPAKDSRDRVDSFDWSRIAYANKGVDWSAFEAARSRLRKQRKGNFTYTDEGQMITDLQVVDEAMQLAERHEVGKVKSQDEMEKLVSIAYGGGNKDPEVIKALALLCWELDLSPNPGLGHVWLIEAKDENGNPKYIATIGIYGLLALAHRDHKFTVFEPRQMDESERKAHGLEDGDVGVIYPILDARQLETFAVLGIKPSFTELVSSNFLDQITYKGVGIWKKGGKPIKKRDGTTYPSKDDNVWKTGSPLEVAKKRALASALKRLGLSPKVGYIPDLQSQMPDGVKVVWDEEDGGLALLRTGETKSKDDPIEGDFSKLVENVNLGVGRDDRRIGDEKPVQSTETPTERFERLKGWFHRQVGKTRDAYDPQQLIARFSDEREAERFTSDIFGGDFLTSEQESVLGRWLTGGQVCQHNIDNWRTMRDEQAKAGETPSNGIKTPPAPPIEDDPPEGLDRPDHDLTLADDDTQTLKPVTPDAEEKFSDDLSAVFPKTSTTEEKAA